MTNHGFIDPGAGERERIDRLEVVLAELLPLVPLTSLDPEVQQMIADLNSDNEVRKERARRRFQELAASDPVPADCTCGAIEYGAMSQHLVPCPLARALTEDCPTPGCDGDGRYAAPGRGHSETCHFPLTEGTEGA